MPISFIFFDLDDTLYLPSSGVWDLIRNRIDDYLFEKLGFPRDAIPKLREHLFQKYGTTLKGLQQVYRVDEAEYLDYVHNVPLENLLQPNTQIKEFLSSLNINKYIFTNADRNHATRIIDALDLQDTFDGIIDIHSISPYCKPQKESFEIALKIAGNPAPEDCILIDDASRNLETAKRIGIHTIFCSAEETNQQFDAHIPNINFLPQIYYDLVSTDRTCN